MKPSNSRNQGKDISNSDLFLYALYLMGGVGRYIDIEDVFVRMWEIAPSRFRWRRHDYPNYKICYTAVSDLHRHEDPKRPLALRSGDGLSRQLTADGIQAVKQKASRLKVVFGVSIEDVGDNRRSNKQLTVLEADARVRRFQSGHAEKLPRHEIAEILRCAPDASPATFRERVLTLQSAATDADRNDLLKFLSWLKSAHTEEFNG